MNTINKYEVATLENYIKETKVRYINNIDETFKEYRDSLRNEERGEFREVCIPIDIFLDKEAYLTITSLGGLVYVSTDDGEIYLDELHLEQLIQIYKILLSKIK